MSESFLANFIAECVNDGKNSPSEMCIVAEERIEKANKEIKKIEMLRLEKVSLYSVIRQLGGNKPKEIREYKNWDFSIPEEELDERKRTLCVNICTLIEKRPLLISEIRDTFASMKLASLEEYEDVYWAAKWLLGRDIIDKDSSMRVIKGSSWDKRPYANNK